jgi:hypothetical protein
MFDPALSLAFSVQSSKGLYAVLLGSGISRAAKIPTGWEITVDLVRRIAAMQRKGSEPDDAVRWYASEFDKEPRYSDLLNAVAKTAAERSLVLRSYFEPTDEEKERNEKRPTTAHKAIADLVAGGYVRVIVTTNFDRLMEQALQAVGIEPTVVSMDTQAQGIGSLAQIRCLVVKVHGDYLEATIKNTPEELDRYEAAMDSLLDRLLDEHGLVVSGWSAEYDTALVRAIERSKNRRYSMYWTSVHSPTDPANKVIGLRDAVPIRIAGADVFFHELAENVAALEKFGNEHPLTIKAAVTRLKQYVAEPARHRVSLHDLVSGTTAELCKEMEAFQFSRAAEAGGVALEDEVQKIANRAELVYTLALHCGWWASAQQFKPWVRCLGQLAVLNGSLPGYRGPTNLSLLPALLCVYAMGVAAVGGDNYAFLKTLFSDTFIRFPERKARLLMKLNPGAVVQADTGQTMPKYIRRYTPMNDFLRDRLRESFKEYLPLDSDYDDVWDRFEYLMALASVDDCLEQDKSPWAPVGRFGWRNRLDGPHISTLVANEAQAARESWPPIAVGFFGGSSDRFERAQEAFLKGILSRVQWI